jgi:hypothetical protein
MRHLTTYIWGLLLLATSCGQVDNQTTNKRQIDTSNLQTIAPSIAGHSVQLPDSIAKKVDLANPYAYLDSEPCKKASDSARTEAKKGNYFYTRMGTYYWTDFEKFYCNYVKKVYGVTMRASCTGFSNSTDDCFYLTANTLVEDKFGKDFIEQTSADAQRLFKNK